MSRYDDQISSYNAEIKNLESKVAVLSAKKAAEDSKKWPVIGQAVLFFWPELAKKMEQEDFDIFDFWEMSGLASDWWWRSYCYKNKMNIDHKPEDEERKIPLPGKKRSSDSQPEQNLIEDLDFSQIDFDVIDEDPTDQGNTEK